VAKPPQGQMTIFLIQLNIIFFKKNHIFKLINYMDMCQTVIGANVAFRQILDGILMQRPSPSLSKSEEPRVIKSKP
jgi:hypothetical protein